MMSYRVLKRKLHIQAAPTRSIIAKNLGHHQPSDVPYAQQPLFNALGQPPTLLEVNAPPSFPVVLQSSKLISLSNIATTRLTPYISLKNLVLWKPWRFLTLESTTPVSLLVTGQSLSVLTLDGSTDYVLFPRDSLLAYAGAALRLGAVRRVKGLPGFEYTLLQGRGEAVVQADGEVHKLVLDSEDEVIVSKKALVAMNVQGEVDCIEPWTLTKTQVEQSQSQDVVKTNDWKHYLQQALNTLNHIKRSLLNVVSGANEYVKVKGPRTVLIQANSSTSPLFELDTENKSIRITESKLEDYASFQSQDSRDYLHYVTVQNGEVKFTSTPDFKATVDKIAKKSG